MQTLDVISKVCELSNTFFEKIKIVFFFLLKFERNSYLNIDIEIDGLNCIKQYRKYRNIGNRGMFNARDIDRKYE